MCVQLNEGQRSRWTLQGSTPLFEPLAKASGYKDKATGGGRVLTRLQKLSPHLDSTYESLKLSFKKASSPLAKDTRVHPQMKGKHNVAHPHNILQSLKGRKE